MIRWFVLFLILGRLIIWTAQVSGPTKRIWQLHPLLEELGECDFCLGFWIFLVLAWAMKINVLAPDYIPVLSEVSTALFASFSVHLVRLGWQMKFSILDLSDN